MTPKIARKRLFTAVVAVLASVEAGSAMSQALEEVVVTARKREESLQDVAVVMQAITADALKASGTTNYGDLNSQITGLNIETAPAVSPIINLRGVTSDGSNISGDAAVSINFDGLQHSSSQLFRFGLFDVGAVEVLKGPQALFYGKNSPGGVISIRTNNPTEEFFSEMVAGYETEGQRKYGSVVLSGPLSDTWGARVGVKYTDQRGYFENQWGKGNPDAEQPFVRFGPNFDSTLVQATLRGDFDKADVTFKVFSGQQNGEDYNQMNPLIDGGCSGPGTYPTTLYGTDLNPYATCELDKTWSAAPWTDKTGSRFGAERPFTDYTINQYSMEANLQLNDNWTVSNIIGFIDIDNSYFGNVGSYADSIISLALASDAQVESLSEEIRFTGSYDGLELMFGAFMDDRFTRSGANVWIAENRTARPDAYVQVNGDSTSVFAQADIDLNPEWTLSVGARHTQETRSVEGYSFATLGAYAEGDHAFANPKIKFDNTSPELTLSYQPQDNFTFFGSYKEGFKSGGYNSSTQDATTTRKVDADGNITLNPTQNDYRPELIEGFEIGFKSELMDNRLRLNGAIYSYDYTDMQLGVIELVEGSPAPKTVNAGASSIDGMELDALMQTSVEAIRIGVNLAYNDAKFDNFLSDCSEWQLKVDPTGCFVDASGLKKTDRAGTPLPAAPEMSASINVMYDDSLSGNMRVRGNVSASYKSEYHADDDNDPRGLQGGATIVGARFGVYSDEDGWAVDLIGRNLTDQALKVYAQANNYLVDPVNGGYVVSAARNAPREFAVELTINPHVFFGK